MPLDQDDAVITNVAATSPKQRTSIVRVGGVDEERREQYAVEATVEGNVSILLSTTSAQSMRASISTDSSTATTS